MANNELLALSSVEMRRRIGTKEISPVELLEACLQQIKAINPAVNAVTAMCVDRARKEAKAAEPAVRRGEDLPLLHGLPTGIKDLEETKDLLTTYGSPLYRDYVPAYDNVMVGRVRAAGAIVVGKTNVPEFGAGSNSRNPVWGATGNPFNPMLNPGGSSGGSAVALATDMLPVCTGSDTGGSLAQPGGVLRRRRLPSLARHGRGRAPRAWAGRRSRCWARWAASVADVCLLYATQIGQHDMDPLSFPLEAEAYAEPWPVDLGSLKVAYTEDFGGAPVEKGIRQTFREQGQGDEASVPPLRQSRRRLRRRRPLLRRDPRRQLPVALPRRLHQQPQDARAQHHRQLRDRREAHAWPTSPGRTASRRGSSGAFQQIYKDYDLVIGPTVGFTPFPWKQLYLDGDGRQEARQLLPLDGDQVLRDADLPIPPSRCRAASTTRRCRSACRWSVASAATARCWAPPTPWSRRSRPSPGSRRPLPNLAKLAKPVPALKSIVTHPPKLNAKASKGPAPGAL